LAVEIDVIGTRATEENGVRIDVIGNVGKSHDLAGVVQRVGLADSAAKRAEVFDITRRAPTKNQRAIIESF
jgi:hypothetical protein